MLRSLSNFYLNEIEMWSEPNELERNTENTSKSTLWSTETQAWL